MKDKKQLLIQKQSSGFRVKHYDEEHDNSNYIKITEEELNGLRSHKLIWKDGKLVLNNEEDYNNYKTLQQSKHNETNLKFKYLNKIRNITDNINALKKKLSDTDFKAIKYSEGLYTDEEYEPIKQQRAEWRKQINDMEAEIERLKAEIE